MPDIGYNDNISVSGRKFHIQTSSNQNKGVARSEVFESGRLITTHAIEFERRKKIREDSFEHRIRDLVTFFHRDVIVEIELLFQIADKVKKLRHAPSNVKLGLLFLSNKLMSDALDQFETAVSIDPDSVAALNSMGLAYIQLGDNARAIQTLREALDKTNHYADIYLNLGMAYLNEKQHFKALQNFQEALRINPQYLTAVYNLAIVYLDSIISDKGDSLLPPPSIRIDRAQQQLKKLESAAGKIFALIYPRVAKAISAADLTSAVQILTENREKVFPTDVLSMIGIDFYLKFMYGGRGLNNELIRRFEYKLTKSIDEHPEYADLWNNLGIVHLIQCRNLFLQALSEFDKALELNPAFEKAQKNKKLVENDGKEFLILLRAILK
jgi:tetratricopeptide (TPR) repeat protein